MHCTDCSTAAQAPQPLPTSTVARQLAAIVLVLVGIALVAIGIIGDPAAIVIAAIPVSAGCFCFSSAEFRAVVRRNAIGSSIFAWHERGMPHEHLERPVEYEGPVIRLRVGGWFRRCRVVGIETPWQVRRCWCGLLEPVIIRHRVTGEAFSSCAPFQLLAKARSGARASIAIADEEPLRALTATAQPAVPAAA